MDALPLALVLTAVVGWCALARPLMRAGLTAAIFFVAAGVLLNAAAGPFDEVVEPELVRTVAEVTLVLVLFVDASRVTLRQFRRDAGIYARLLALGLPLTVGLGTAVALGMLGLEPWAALLVGAALAPTDAALGSSLVTDPRVPEQTRRALNVESGLNDGLATPVVVLAIAGVAATSGLEGVEGPGRVFLTLLVGAGAGAVIGGVGGLLTHETRRRGWLTDELGGPAVLALALLSYVGAHAVHANGFVAAFIGGLAYAGAAGHDEGAHEVHFVDQTGALASMVSWLLFGALAVPVIGSWFSGTVLLYAVLSLTLIRMLPVVLVLLGAGFRRFDVMLIAWFGPRGLASVTFALLTFESLGAAGREPVAVIALTVLLSVVLHGVTARPLARRSQPDRTDEPNVAEPK